MQYQHRDRAGRWLFVSRETNQEKLLSQLTTGKTRPDAVSIVPFVQRPYGDAGVTYRLAVTREFRPTTGGYEYCFPAGLIDGDETVEGAAARE